MLAAKLQWGGGILCILAANVAYSGFVDYEHCEILISFCNFSHFSLHFTNPCVLQKCLTAPVPCGDFSRGDMWQKMSISDNSEEVSNEESRSSDRFHCTSSTTNTKEISPDNESYLSDVPYMDW
jgi:hypothetical protein